MGADYDGTSEALLDRLSARAGIPELDTLKLPDDWRADQARDPNQCCTTCHWNGRWAQLVELGQTSPEQKQEIGGLLRQLDDRLDQTGPQENYLDALDEIGRYLSRDPYPSRPQGYEKALIPHALRKSASNGNLCCAIFLALTCKFDVKGNESEWSKESGVYINPPWGLKIGHECTRVKDIYISCHSSPSQAPPGATVYPNGGHKSIDPRSEESLTWAKSHIDECVNTHDCHAFQSKEAKLPTRLVYIPKDAQASGVQLIKDPASLPKDTRYAALSHCWGEIRPSCLTTIDNIDKYAIEGIPWAQIPPTFQDAMLYARRLDLEFIWIDSICIVQGNGGDWRGESTRMFQYYSNAYVTLASTFSKDCNGGFFSERHLNATRIHLLDVEFRGQSYPVYASRISGTDYVLDFFEQENKLQNLGNSYQLLRRAWIYQEQLVSPRLLLFSERQLIFECYGGRWYHQTKENNLNTRKTRYGASLSNTADETAESSWLDFLSAFGTLQITYAKDKLPAIAAVAKQFLSHQKLPHTPEHEYLCGLRRSHLHVDLMWAAKGDYEKADPKIYWRGESYLAPTWSWASVPRETTYGYKTLLNVEKKPTVTLMKEHLKFAGDDRFGQVLGGYITIEGPACDCWSDVPFHRESVDSSYMWKGCRVGLPGTDRFDCNIRFWLDVTNVRPRVEKLTLLQTWVSVDGTDVGFLVLYKNSANGLYRRLGAGNHSRPQLKVAFEEAGRRELDIE